MIKTVVSIDLPVDENLLIKKNTLCFNKECTECNTHCGKNKKISIVTGIHGDELEG